MKTFSKFSAFALSVVVVIMMAMMVQASDLFGETNADPEFIPPGEYGGKLYYKHKDIFNDFSLAQDNCAVDGGMLAEITDWNEMEFFLSYLSTEEIPENNYIVIGGFYWWFEEDEDIQLQWLVPSTKRPFPVDLLDYYCPNCDNPDDYSCLAIRPLSRQSTSRYEMIAVPCNYQAMYVDIDLQIFAMGYMCEKIYASYSTAQLPNADTNIPAIEFRDKIYYIHKKLFTDYQDSLEDCRADGGMMAEINDGLEFQVVHKYVNSTFTSGDHVFIGGKKIGNSWVLPSTNQPLPYVKWGHHEPYVYLDFFTCLILFGKKGWNMASMYCDTHPHSFPNFRFLCEKPIDSY